MIALKRLEEPRVLVDNKATWLAEYQQELVAAPKKRPRSARYAHREIVERLEAMSFHKCFYCEQSTKEMKKNVDHYVECTERPDLAFEWTNLYLSCCDCNNGKPSNRDIPVADCVDPCDPAMDPADHLTFKDELIDVRNDSERGRQTIRKYRLDRPELDRMRARRLIVFLKAHDVILERMNQEGRNRRTPDEEAVLREFGQPEKPFSLMCRTYLASISL